MGRRHGALARSDRVFFLCVQTGDPFFSGLFWGTFYFYFSLGPERRVCRGVAGQLDAGAQADCGGERGRRDHRGLRRRLRLPSVVAAVDPRRPGPARRFAEACGNFDIIFDRFFRMSQLQATPHTRRALSSTNSRLRVLSPVVPLLCDYPRGGPPIIYCVPMPLGY